MAYEPIQHNRSCLGLLLAPVAGTMVFFVGLSFSEAESVGEVVGSLVGLVAVSLLLGAGPVTVLLGIPLYLLLRRRVRPTPLVCGAFGALLGVVPAVFWGFALDWWVTTLAAFAGAVGGIVFWWTAHDEIERSQLARSS